MIIERIISKNIIDEATNRVNQFQFGQRGKSLFGSERDRTLIGYIGEYMVMDYLKIEIEDDQFDYDLIYANKKLEVKSISCKFKPKLNYLCTVNSFNLKGVHKQKADFYVFTRIINNMSKGWILGFIDCQKFFNKGTFVKKGSNVVPGVKFWKANATILPINELTSIQKIKKFS